MKRKNVFLLVTLVFALALVFTACGGGGGGSGALPQTAVYTSTDGSGNTYRLTITENLSRSYAGAAGDTYELVITFSGGGIKVSRGIVANKTGDIFQLKPENAQITFTIGISGTAIISFSGTITFTDNTTLSDNDAGGFPPPDTVYVHGTWVSDTEPATLPGSGGLRFNFTGMNEWTETGIISHSTIYANGTYVVDGNSITLTTINYWNGTVAVPNVVTWTGTVSSYNSMSIVDQGTTYTFSRPALTISNNAGNTTVKITTATISGGTNFDSLSSVIAGGQGSYPLLTWPTDGGQPLNGTYNVMLRLAGCLDTGCTLVECPIENGHPKPVKYQNGVTFTKGSGTVNWNTMTAIP